MTGPLPEGEGWGVDLSHQWGSQAAQADTRLPLEIRLIRNNDSSPLPSSDRGPKKGSGAHNQLQKGLGQSLDLETVNYY